MGYVIERNKIDKQPESLRQYNNLHRLSVYFHHFHPSHALLAPFHYYYEFFFSGQRQCGMCYGFRKRFLFVF